MNWYDDPTDHAATLIVGDLRCHVWHTSHATWAAEVSRTDGETTVHHLATREDAQAWCEARVREGRAWSTARDLSRLRACLAAMAQGRAPRR
jgi:hypothetical protein